MIRSSCELVVGVWVLMMALCGTTTNEHLVVLAVNFGPAPAVAKIAYARLRALF
jgi:hypothetical protein